jgi:phosphatidylserine decarboxylase precursor-related protein
LVYFLIDTPSLYPWIVAALLAVLWFFVAAFFREPRRVQIHDDELIFSPCDGRVVVTEVVTDDEYLKGEMLQVSIFMSVTNVHMNWLPVGGEVSTPSTTMVASSWHGTPSRRQRMSVPLLSSALRMAARCSCARLRASLHAAS